MVPNKLLDHYLKEIQNGEIKALASLYQDTKTSVYSFALSILKNKALAEETLQDVYIKIYENVNLYKPSDKPLAWILTITKNTAFTKLKKEKNNVDIDLYKDILSNTKNNTDNNLFLSYLFKHVNDEERTIIFLHIISGFKHTEIAKILDIPLGTVLSKYKRTMDKLKEIGKEDYER